MIAVGATAVGVSAVGVSGDKNYPKFWTIINIGSTNILWGPLLYVAAKLNIDLDHRQN